MNKTKYIKSQTQSTQSPVQQTQTDQHTINITSVKKLNETLLQYDTDLSIVNLTATWCGPCRAVAPKVNELIKKYNMVGHTIKLLKVDIDKARDVSELYSNISTSVPTFIFYDNVANGFEVVVGANIKAIEITVAKYFEKLQNEKKFEKHNKQEKQNKQEQQVSNSQ